jgi:hypothetical protein
MAESLSKCCYNGADFIVSLLLSLLLSLFLSLYVYIYTYNHILRTFIKSTLYMKKKMFS